MNFNRLWFSHFFRWYIHFFVSSYALIFIYRTPIFDFRVFETLICGSVAYLSGVCWKNDHFWGQFASLCVFTLKNGYLGVNMLVWPANCGSNGSPAFATKARENFALIFVWLQIFLWKMEVHFISSPRVHPHQTSNPRTKQDLDDNSSSIYALL